MNNRFKFRAWDTKNKKWMEFVPSKEYMIDSDEWDRRDCGDEGGEAYLFFPNNPMGDTFNGRIVYQQFTGLTDESEKDIYEGDMLSWSDYQGWEDGRTFRGYYEVKWNELDAKFELKDLPSGDIFEIGNTKFENVIGNIFETPKLLIDAE